MGLAAHPIEMKTGGFASERPWRHGRSGCLACQTPKALTRLFFRAMGTQ